MAVIDSDEEERLVGAVKRAVDLVRGGDNPTDALEKIARADGFGPGRIRILGHAYNTGSQLSQWDSKASILNKLAEFPLADPEQVIARIYGEEKQAEIDPAYFRPPDWLKQPRRMEKAAAVLPAPVTGPQLFETRMTQVESNIQRLKHAADNYVQRAELEEDRVKACANRLEAYFRKSASDRLPFAHVEHAAVTYLGEAVRPLLDMLYKRAHLREPRDDGKLRVTRAVDQRFTPFADLDEAMKSAAECGRMRLHATEKKKEVEAAKQAMLRPFPKAGEPEKENTLWSEKAAGILGTPAAGAFLGSMLSRTIGNAPKSNNELVEDAWMDLEDPEHANELRKIKAHAILTQLLTDPDDPISGHEPDRVLQAYNEISQVAPRAAENVASLRPLLRKRLEGHQEPFEVKEMTDIEKGIAQSKLPTPNTNLLGETPDKILS